MCLNNFRLGFNPPQDQIMSRTFHIQTGPINNLTTNKEKTDVNTYFAIS